MYNITKHKYYKTMNNEITLLKLYNGSLILGELTDGFSDTYSLDNPREVGIMPTMTGSIQMALTSVCAPFKVKRLKDHIDIPKTQVMFNLNADEIDSELINGYKSDISGIKLATPSDMAAINTKASNTNEFII